MASKKTNGLLSKIKLLRADIKKMDKDTFVPIEEMSEPEDVVEVAADWSMKSMNLIEAWINDEKHVVEAEVVLHLNMRDLLQQKDRNDGLNLDVLEEAADAVDQGKIGDELEELITMALVPRTFASVHSIIIHRLEPKLETGGVVINEKELVTMYLIDEMVHFDYGRLLIPATEREAIILDPALFAHMVAVSVNQFEKRESFDRFFEFEDPFGSYRANVRAAVQFSPF